MTIPFPMPTFPSPTAAMPSDSIAFIARGNDNQIIAGLNQVEASIAALGHTLTFGTHLQSAGTSYNGSANVTIATDATSANTVSTIVARDSSGNFSANSITLAGTITMTTAASQLIPGATSFAVTNHAGTRANLTVQETGAIVVGCSDLSLPTLGFTAQNGDMPSGALMINQSTVTGHRAFSIFANDGTAGITVGAYYFTQSAVETVWQYANAIGKAQGSTAFQFYPKGGEVSFGQNYAASGNTKAFIRMYGTTTSNAGGSATLIVQQGGITTDTLAASSLISANGGLTVASGQTLTLTGVTVVGLSFTPITGNLTYAQLPTGNGTWDTGAGTLITIARSITVSGTTSTVGFTVSNTASFLNASPFSMSGGGGNVVTVAITLPTAGATVTIPDFAGVNDTFAFVTLAQTLANKTLASSCSVPASTLTGNLAYAALPTGNGSWDTGAGTTATITRAFTVSGQLTASVGMTGGSNALAADYLVTLNTAAGQNRNIEYLTGGVLRWEVAVNNATESGSNVGSNFKIVSFDDSGTLIGNAMVITRSTMAVNFAATVTAATGFINGSNTLAATLGCFMNTAAGQLRQFDFQSGGVDRWLVRVDNTAESGSNAGSNFSIMARSDAGASIGSAIAITRSTMLVTLGAGLGVTGLVSTYNNVATAGFGVAPIYAAGSVVAKANATSGTVATYTPAADGTFVIFAEVTVTASTTFSFTVTCTYTDDGGTARTQTFSFVQAGGTGVPVQTLTNTLGVGAYAGNPQTIRAKGANAITIQTATGGTFTTVTYSIRAAIIQLSA